METNKILSADLLDLLFDDRNKAYGAYELRRTYQKRMTKALLITTTFALLAFAGVVIGGSLKNDKPPKDKMKEVILSDYKLDEKPPEKLPEPEKKPETQVKTEIFTQPKIVEQVLNEPMPPQEDLIDSKIGLEKHDGEIDDGIPKPEKVDDGRGILEGKKNIESDEPFITVEIDAKFKGNWKSFLERNLNANVPVDNEAPAGNYSVVVQFVVDTAGNVSDIKTLTNHGYGMEAEAVRVLRKAAKWEPAVQNDIKVKAYRKQIITFQVLEDE